MKRPVFEGRSKDGLMEALARRAGEYAPEWRYEPGDAEPGAAIATLFGELFYQTVDRFNQTPEKNYAEFLKLLGVRPPAVTPAQGYVAFELGGEPDRPVAVPGGTEVYAAGDEGQTAVYSTSRSIVVTGANLEQIYYADPGQGRIERLDMSLEQPFFAPAGGENLQSHRFALCHNEVLCLKGPCAIEVELRQSSRALEQSAASRLADTQFARWTYFDGQDYRPFDSAAAQGGVITLELGGQGELYPDEEGNIYVYCDVYGATGELTVSGAALRSRVTGPQAPDALANGDVALSLSEGGYCFGRRPSAYELFYIRADRVFQKRGARVSVKLEISAVVRSEVGAEPQYEFNKRIIDKSDAVRVMPDDVFVQQVVWEYYNGQGWADLAVSGNVNPFSCKGEKDREVLFTVPMDMKSAVVNAQEGFYIRARAVNVENFLSAAPRWLLPFVKGVWLAYQYADFVAASCLWAQNNGKRTQIQGADRYGDLNFTLFSGMEPHPRAMYLCFDASPHAMPLSLLFDIRGRGRLVCKPVYEMWTGDRFEAVQTQDNTQGLSYTGIVFLYLPRPLEKGEFFSKEGFWLRVRLSAYGTEGLKPPRVEGIRLNAVSAGARQRAQTQYFSTQPYDAGKVIRLMERPAMDWDVWIDEREGLSELEIEELRGRGQAVLEQEGEGPPRVWVRWSPISSLVKALPGQRVYEPDPWEGTITFGRGQDGRVPPKGDLNIRVDYFFGTGTEGNLPLGRVNALVGSIPRINGVQNITAMSGGTDRPDTAKLEGLGNKRLRHRQRAVGPLDFEEMTLENFPRADRVKCFSCTGPKGEPAPGHVCLAVKGGLATPHMNMELCRDIYAFLADRCDCNLAATGKLHVVPSTEVTVNVDVTVKLKDPEEAAATQSQVCDCVNRLITEVWGEREIGEELNVDELYRAVMGANNVLSVTRLLAEGSYYIEGRACLSALDGGLAIAFATVKSGRHNVKIG